MKKYRLIFLLLSFSIPTFSQEQDFSVDIEVYMKQEVKSKFDEEFPLESKERSKFSLLREFLEESQNLYVSLIKESKNHPDRTKNISTYQNYIDAIKEIIKNKNDIDQIDIDPEILYYEEESDQLFFNKAIKTSVNDLKKVIQRYEKRIQNIRKDSSILQLLSVNIKNVKSDIKKSKQQMGRLELDVKQQDFRSDTSRIFAFLIGALLIIFFTIVFIKSDHNLSRELLSGYGLQFITLFVLIIAVILFGILGILQSSELAAILSGISGYILGKGIQASASSSNTPSTSIVTPAITSITPNQGNVAGGTNIRIVGAGFVNGALVKIGNVTAMAVVIDSNNIDAITPANAIGSVNVVVTNPDGKNVTSANGFTYI